MMMPTTVKGIDAMVRYVTTRAKKRLALAIGGALYLEGNNIMAATIPRTPHDKGPLWASGYVTLPNTDEQGNLKVELGFGGAAAKYAVRQHEGIILRGKERFPIKNYTEPGTGAKFLEISLIEAQAGLAGRLGSLARQLFDSGTTTMPTGSYPTRPK